MADFKDGGNVTRVLNNHLNLIQSYEKKIESANVTPDEHTQFQEAIESANAEIRNLRDAGQLKIHTGVKTNNIAALERLGKTLASNKGVVEQAGTQVHRAIINEVKLSKDLLEEATRKNYDTVTGIEGGGIGSAT